MFLFVLIGSCFWITQQTSSAPAASQPAEIAIREFLIIEPVGRAGRSPIHTDAIEARIVAGESITPREGDSVQLPDGSRKTWTAAKTGEDGTLVHDALRGGYAYVRVETDADGVWLLEAAGHGLVYVNGQLRTGDPYSLGFLQLPVRLERGPNHLLFQGSRGNLRAKLVRPKGPIVFLAGDVTTPTVRDGAIGKYDIGVPLANCTTEDQHVLIEVVVNGRASRRNIHVDVPQMSVAKVTAEFDLEQPPPPKEIEIQLKLGRNLAEALTFPIAVVGQQDVCKRTFVSEVDHSVQYYAVRPARPKLGGAFELRQSVIVPDADPPMILSLHGASVEASSQAAAYGATWADIVAPTNRRPFGFDWEDWGRLDALEVLDRETYNRNGGRRVYLTGHSMGGHGTWQIGVTIPDRFAAIGPSAGWISFWSYGGMKRFESGNSVVELLQRAANPSDTLALLTNLTPRGVYILHGEADDNVPVAQAREMREKLAVFHRDFQWHEQPGAGHWWESSDEPGAECVDWPPMMDFFARRRLPYDSEVREVDFATASPGVSAKCHWLAIEQQVRPLALSHAKLRCDPLSRRYVGTTDNVRRMSLDLGHLPDGAIAIELDGQRLDGITRPHTPARMPEKRENYRMFARRPGGYRIYLERDVDGWRVCEPAPATEKGPHRYGPFKAAFDNRFVLVIGTHGTEDENLWAFRKARYDAETWWYRGNGTARVLTDDQYLENRRDSNVILYGHISMNRAWAALLADSPIQVERDVVRIGTREIRGDDLACLFVRPIPGSETASVGVVAGTGLSGMRLADRVPYFVSGVAFPDCTVLSADTLSRGVDGIRATGFFGHDWRIETGEFAFSD